MTEVCTPTDTDVLRSRNTRTRTCKRCKFATSSAKDFLQHQMRAHGGGGENDQEATTFDCDQCDYICISHAELLKHRNRMHSSRVKRTSTDDEQPGTPTSVDLDEVKNDIPTDVTMYDDRSDENQLVKMGITLPTRTYTCAHCRWSTTSSRRHLYHLVEDHGYDYTIYECDLCDYATRYKQKLPRHQRCHYASSTDSPNLKSPPQTEQSQTGSRRKNSHPGLVCVNNYEIEDGVDEYDTAEEVDMTEYWKSDENDETASQASGELRSSTRDINENLKASLNRPPYNAIDAIIEQTKSPVVSLEKRSQEDHSDKSSNSESLVLESKLGSKVEVTASSPTSILAESVAKWQGSAVNVNDSLLQYDEPPALVIDDTPTTPPANINPPVLTPQSQPPPKSTPEKKKNGAPIREAVDPAKYIRVQDVDGIKFACSKCGNIYKWRKSLNKHWKEKHDGEIPVPISTSGAAFTMLNVPRLAAAAASNRLIALPHVSKAGRSKPSYTSPIKTNGLINDSPTMVSNAYPTMKDTFSPDSFSLLGKNAYSSLSDSYPTMKNLFSKELYKSPAAEMARADSLAKTPWHVPVDHNKWGMNEVKSAGVKRSLSPSVTTHPHSRPTTPVHLGPAHSYKRDVSQLPPGGVTQPPLSYKPSTSPYSSVIPPAAHSHGRSTTPQVCDAVPLDLSQNTSVKDEPMDDDVLDLSKPTVSSKLFNTSVDSAIDFSVRPNKSDSPVKNESDVAGKVHKPFVWECYKCSFVACTPDEYEQHRHVHKAEVYRCTICELHFMTIYELNIHFRKHHEDVLIEKLKQESEMNGSNELNHSNTTLSCIVCGETVTQANHLWKHYTEAHQGLPNPYERYHIVDEVKEPDAKCLKLDDSELSCNQCAFTARDADEMSRHHLIHALNRPFACSMCGYSTRWKHDLQQHVKRYHENRTPSPAPAEPPSSESPPSSVEKQTYLRQLGLYSKDDEQDDAVKSPQANGKLSEGSASPDSASGNRRVRGGGKTGTSSAEMLLPYKCTVCEYRARWPSEIAQHMKNHSDEKPFACPRCTYKSKWKWDVVKHLKRCGGGTVNDVIDTTKVGKKGQLAGPAWMKAVQFKEQSPTSARGLSSGPPNVTVSASMLASNDSLSPGKNDDSSLVSHLQEVRYNSANLNTQDKRHHCLQCPFVGDSLMELKRHQREHSSEKPFACGTCGYCSKWKCDLKKHLRTYNHTTDSLTDINDSEQESANDDDLIIAEEDTRKSLYKCDRCQYVTYKKAQLDVHVKIHGGDRGSGGIRCKQCDFEANDISSFLQHKLTHRADSREGSVDKESGMAPSRNRRKPQKQFRCPKCPFSSYHREQINLHYQSHKADGNFGCAYCDYHADDGDSLEEHQKVHPEYFNNAMDTSPDDEDDETLNLSGKLDPASHNFQFKCEWCDFSVNQADLLLSHVKVSHHDELAKKEMLVKMGDKAVNGIGEAPQRRRRMKMRYQCKKCHFATFNRKCLIRHYRLHFITSKYTRRAVARATFKLANQSQHAVVHSNNNNAILNNKNLSMKLKETQMNGSFHFQLITNEKIHRFKCLSCPYHTYNESLLTNHTPRHQR